MAAKKQAAAARAVETDDDLEEVDEYGLEFDPGDYTAVEILEYVKKNPEDRQHVRDAEAAGKARVTILNALDEDDDDVDEEDDEEDEAPKSRSKVKVSQGLADDQPLEAVAMASTEVKPSIKRGRVKGTFTLYYGRQKWEFEDDHTYDLPNDLYEYLKGYGNIYDTAR